MMKHTGHMKSCSQQGAEQYRCVQPAPISPACLFPSQSYILAPNLELWQVLCLLAGPRTCLKVLTLAFAHRVPRVRRAVDPPLCLSQTDPASTASPKACTHSSQQSLLWIYSLCPSVISRVTYSVLQSPPSGSGMAHVPHLAFSCTFPQGRACYFMHM